MAEGASGKPSRPAQAIHPGPGGRFRGGRIEKARDPRGAVRRLLVYMIPHRRTLAGVFLLVVIGSLLELAGPILMGVAIDRFIAVRDLDGLLRMALLMLAVYGVSWVAQLIPGMVMAATAQKAMRVLRRELFEHLQTLSLSFFDRHPHGELMSRLTNDLTAISHVLSQNVTQLFAGLLSLAGIIIAMFAVNFRLALASMLVLPLMMALVGFVGRRTRSGFREYQMRIGQLNGTLEEMFSGQRVVIAFGQEAKMLGEFDAANETVRAVGVKAQTY
jgi:ATP-binding cassette, subfamily B, multidrug efflux pump